jgi:RimJ/RimL family protein N-acetyltransferase
MQGLVRGRPADVPVIETARLRLRAHRADDLAACAAMWADPAVTRYIGGKPATRQETWTKLLRYAGLWSLLGYGYWALEDRPTSGFIGELGFADFMRDMEPSLAGRPEIGWALASHAHGNGYASEAVAAAVAWADAAFGTVRTVCLIGPENVASIRVAEKCGYREFARTEYKGEATILFER